MENTIYLGLSRQMTLKTDLDIIANNVANIGTPGYRAQNLLFHEFISDPRGADDELSFVYDEGQYEITAPGPIKQTGNSLDVSVMGPGFIGINGPGGETAYTRAGNFEMTPEGILITSAGFEVSGDGGGNIVIPDDAREINIADNGDVSTQNGVVGRIELVEFANLQELEPMGNNLYRTDAATTPPANTRLRQGQLEGSNVKPVIEMTRMIDTLRSFQSMNNLLEGENTRLRTAIRQLTGQN